MVEPHPEIVNEIPSVLIVGYGHVGRHIAQYFPRAHYVDNDAVFRDLSGAPTTPLCYTFGFICVPTPEASGGFCDTSIVQSAVRIFKECTTYLCIKSTVEVGTTELLGDSVCFSPEYYGESLGHPFAESAKDPFIILGGPPNVTRAFAELWTLVTNSGARIFQADSRTAELCKLAENAFLATKVAFCNQLYDLANLAGVDYNELRELWLLDPRVGRSHTYVYPNNRGFAGKCLPKDTANLCAWARDKKSPAMFIEYVREYNERLREKRG